MKKDEIADILEEIALLLELKGENPFKIRAYQNGARTLLNLEEDLETLIANDKLGEVKGIGKALVDKITTLYETGELPFYDDLKESIPAGLIAMLEVPGLGAKKIKKLHEALGIESLEALTKACQDGSVAALPGFGEKTAQKIEDGIRNVRAYNARHIRAKLTSLVEEILQGLRALPEVKEAEVAGSYRRGAETVGDLDFIVASPSPLPIMDWFTGQNLVQEISAKGETKSSIRTAEGIQADLRVVPLREFPFALHHFTGSKDHNVAMRQRALAQGYSLSEWGLFPKGESEEERSSLEAKSETALFSLLKLDYIPPELREGRHEIRQAEEHDLPNLVEISDIQGVFHNHTTASDGRNTLEEMTFAAQKLGFSYLGIADHSQSSVQARGLSPARLEEQVEKIQQLNESGEFSCYLFAGSEVDILKDGRLDYEDALLAKLDYVVASIHSSFSLSEEEMTARLIKAIEHPQVTMIGHLTGRILLKRDGYRLDIPKVIDAAITNQTIIELNANPRRLDMDWRFWEKAAERGLITSINPDAHTTDGLGDYVHGVLAARKGGLQKEHILNTKSLEEVRELLQK